jgi:hypothetical protein
MAKQSPYQKYQKVPFKYEHPSCRHSRAVPQSLPESEQGRGDGFRGTVCASCNIIIENLGTEMPRRRFFAEAA